MTIGVCITTRHRPELLGRCLKLLDSGKLKPSEVVVSDDSVANDMQSANASVVSAYPNAKYVRGPCKGVCANRNNALKHMGPVDFVGYIDDDGMVSPNYLEAAQRTYDSMSETRQKNTILTGTRINAKHIEGLVRINFQGYFARSNTPQVAGASYAIYPKAFFDAHEWDERIFFGYEDAELSLRALKSGYEILYVPDMVITDAARGNSTVLEQPDRVSAYDFHGEAARLYVGVKRYAQIEKNYAKLGVFLPLFFAQISYSLAKRRSLHLLPKLIKQSNVIQLFRDNSPKVELGRL